MEQLSKNIHSAFGWFCIKFSFSVIWLVIISIMISAVEKCLYPSGICRLYSFEVLFTVEGKMFLMLISIGAIVAYLAEFKMAYTTLLLFFISVVIISFHESNGIFYRATILSMVWAAQSIAYFQAILNKKFNLIISRHQYVCQMIAAIYILAAIAKLNASGLAWGIQTDGFALQVAKNLLFQYYDTGNELILIKAKTLSNFFADYKIITALMLYTALFLESFSFIGLVNKKLRVMWALGLLLMHLGIAIFMGIGISVICFPMVIFFLNPLYYIFKGVLIIKNQFFLS